MNSEQNTSTPSHAVQCFRALLAAAKDARLVRSDVACLGLIVDYYNRERDAAWPGLNRLATEADIHRATVIRSIQRLEEFGYLMVERGGRGRSNRYRPAFGSSSTGATSRIHATSRTNATEVVAPVRLELVAPVRPEPTYRTYPKNLPNNSREKARSDRFDEFWSAYPRKEGSKDKARKSWVRQKLDAQYDQVAADVIKRIKGDPQWRTRQFIPHPVTYLNQQRWKDDWKPEPEAFKPRANDNFEGKKYVGTPIDQMHPSLRAGIEREMRAAGESQLQEDVHGH